VQPTLSHASSAHILAPLHSLQVKFVESIITISYCVLSTQQPSKLPYDRPIHIVT